MCVWCWCWGGVKCAQNEEGIGVFFFFCIGFILKMFFSYYYYNLTTTTTSPTKYLLAFLLLFPLIFVWNPKKINCQSFLFLSFFRSWYTGVCMCVCVCVEMQME